MKLPDHLDGEDMALLMKEARLAGEYVATDYSDEWERDGRIIGNPPQGIFVQSMNGWWVQGPLGLTKWKELVAYADKYEKEHGLS